MRTLSNELSAAWLLSAALAVLMGLQSGISLVFPSVYRDTGWVIAAWFGNDLVTLFFAVPVMTWSLVAVRQGSRRAELIWYSMLGYAVYNYGYYLFGAALNWLFPLYVLTFVIPVFALILALGRLDARVLAREFSSNTPIRWIVGYMLFTGIGLSFAWIGQWANFMLTGSTPDIGEQAFRLVASMDLSLVVPWFLVGAVLLMQRQAWGYVIAPIIITKGATYTLVLTVTSSVAALRGVGGTLEQIPIWAVWTLGGALAIWALLSHLQPGGQRVAARP